MSGADAEQVAAMDFDLASNLVSVYPGAVGRAQVLHPITVLVVGDAGVGAGRRLVAVEDDVALLASDNDHLLVQRALDVALGTEEAADLAVGVVECDRLLGDRSREVSSDLHRGLRGRCSRWRRGGL